MSYRRAWILVDELNRSLAGAAVESAIGGEHGGGSTLTALGARARRRLPPHRGDRDARLRRATSPACSSSRRRALALRATPTITLDALKTASAGAPGARPSARALAWVTMATTRRPPASISTSALTAPGCTLATVPASWLRADSSVAPASATTTTDDALTSANAGTPTARPSRRALARDDGDDALTAADADLDLVVDGAGDDRADRADEAGCARSISSGAPRGTGPAGAIAMPASMWTTSSANASTSAGIVRDEQRSAPPGAPAARASSARRRFAQRRVERGERLVEQQRARLARRARAPAPRAGAGRPRAGREAIARARRSSNASSQRRPPRRRRRGADCASRAARPKAMFWRTVRCGNSA